MKFAKKTEKILKEFEHKLLSSKKEKIIDSIERNNDTYFIISQNENLGVFLIKTDGVKSFIKVYFLSRLDELHKNNFIDLLQSFCSKLSSQYLFISHCFDSENILDSFIGIDRMFRYEIDKSNFIFSDEIHQDLLLQNQIKCLDELIELHEICYADDPDYLLSDWRTMLQNFVEVSIPQITILYYKSKRLIGACIGYHFPTKNEKYIYSVCVLPEFRKQRIAQNLIREFLLQNPITPCYLTVYESAFPAVKLYEKIRFRREQIVSVILKNKES